MALVRLGFHIEGDKQYERAFESFGLNLDDMSEPLADMGELVRHSVAEQFQTEGAHSGDPWARLTAAYEAWKRSRFGGAPILVQTGEMRHEMLDPFAVTVTPRSMTYEPRGPHVDLAVYHQFGRGHNPARRMVDLNSPDRRGIDRAFAEWLNRLRHESGLGRAA